MRILAVIPARGGSKRLPKKNIKPLGGKPLINWSIEAIRGISEICEVLVSTDDTQIASIAKRAGASVPWLRPNNLSTDTASSIDVALHALDWYESKFNSVEGLLLLQPTSPFRTRKNIENGIDTYVNSNFSSVVAVTPAKDRTALVFKNKDNFISPFTNKSNSFSEPGDSVSSYWITGSFYLSSPSILREKKTFLPLQTVPLIIESPIESIDIDTEWDFQLAKYIAGDIVEKN
jgi:CMP-N-acetylneuraminic acid synthetase